MMISSGSKEWSHVAEDQVLSSFFKQIQLSSKVVVLWNDSPPDPKQSYKTFGHSKGVLSFDPESERGFLLHHSVTHFPVVSGD